MGVIIMFLLQGTLEEFQNAGMFDNIMLRGYFLDDRDEGEPIGGYEDDECEDDEYCGEEDE